MRSNILRNNLLPLLLLASSAQLPLTAAAPLEDRSKTCKQTKVLVLGAGMAGITAAQTLSNASIHDFLIVEYNPDIGGRVAHTTFGADKSGKPYTVELGANWVQGLGTPGGPENPIWTLAKKYKLQNTYSNYSLIQTFNASGPSDFSSFLDDYETAYSTLEQDAGIILSQNLQDRSLRAGLATAGWNPKRDSQQQAAEWWEFDWEYSYAPDQSSEVFAVVNYNTTFYQYSDENNYVFDPRGFNAFIKGEASTFLKPNDPRLLLNSIVTSINTTSTSVTATLTDGTCICASYAICTFSLGVLQNDVVTFTPPLPAWKQAGIATMQMGTYTKIFLQFPPDKQFWDPTQQFYLYADPIERGYYPVFQSLSSVGFLPGSGILFVTVVGPQSYRVEKQSDDVTKAQVLEVLRAMYGKANVPDPIAFMYPRWSGVEWAFGSYSNWPPGLSLEMHQNLRANVGRLWFAGEATHPEYYGFLQGAYFEGQAVGQTIAACVKGQKSKCVDEPHYEKLIGVTPVSQLTELNGWEVTSFQTNGF